MAKPTESYQSSVNEIGLAAAASTPPSPKGRVRGVGRTGSSSNPRSNPSRMTGEEEGGVANGIGSGERGRQKTRGWLFGFMESMDGWKKCGSGVWRCGGGVGWGGKETRGGFSLSGSGVGREM